MSREEILLLISDSDMLINKIQKEIDIFYPNWNEWLNSNHQIAYEKLQNRLQEQINTKAWLEEQLEALSS